MKYKILPIANFKREFKKLAKKYPSLKKEVRELGQQLAENPLLGTALGNECYKIRLAIKSKPAGKSGGARVITHLHIHAGNIYLLSIFDKADKDSISDKQIETLIKTI